MSQNDQSSDRRSALLAYARRLRQRGDAAGARTLLRSFLARYPAEPQVWLLLASVAETRAEQRQAFEIALAYDPTNQVAARGLDVMQRRAAPVPDTSTPTFNRQAEPNTVAPTPSDQATRTRRTRERSAGEANILVLDEAVRARRIRWPLFAVLGLAAIVLLVSGLLIRQSSAAQQASRPTLAPLPAAAVTLASSTPLVATAASSAPPTATPQPAVVSTAPPPPVLATPASLTTPAPQPTLTPAAFGQIARAGVWNIGLLRPTDAVLLSGSIGDLQPQGRFVLALLAVGNTASSDQQLPPELITLSDARGNRYTAQPLASSAFLQTFGAGQSGLISMEQAVPAGGGLVSVPVIFDVPSEARGLTLSISGDPTQWSLGG
ncbi:MAG: tetratricopeptide repeat protein [Roseiflexaceae bacterium]|nr:tetratricopeptide repeat protein [Roseiflexaceae bacterium]